uniref:NADH dehydrogenase subunit 6 n=1 Tax=Solen strictus TaxID=194331 RepID=H9M5V1_9BIVA|nr:NADH dehydrogenase subunit 6 [Solen strictus]AER38718.1 NADH dehydrogenase subunit 6 [Solen strictus]
MVLCLFFSFLVLSCAAFLTKSEHPLTLMASIILVSLFMGIIVSVEKSAMFGAFLILVYVGGVMIAFCYSSSLTPNPDFYAESSKNSVVVGYTMTFFFFFICVFFGMNFLDFFGSLSDSFQFDIHLGFNEGWGLLVLEIMVVLVVIMVGVVSITGISSGALVLFGN